MTTMIDDCRAAQSLQQFVNQSPWDWGPVRQHLAQVVAADSPPLAWTLHEVVFPKTGRHSVGVDHQFSGLLGRATNCQLGLVLCMVTEKGVFPVHWCLSIPPSWDSDHERRQRCSLPGHERHRPLWQCVLSIVDEVNNGWGLPWVPLIADLRHEPDAERLIGAFHARGVSYLLRVGGSFGVHPLPSGKGDHDNAIRPLAPTGAPMRLATLTHRLAQRPRQVVSWENAVSGQTRRSQFVVNPVWPAHPPQRYPTRDQYQALPVRVIANWPLGHQQPQAYWITDLVGHRIGALMRLLSAADRTSRDVLGEEFGLYDFEGRSYRGWHHHVTLVSIAHAFDQLFRHSPRDSGPSQPSRGEVGADAGV